MPKPNLSDHDLKQMDEAWQVGQSEPVVRGLLNRALEDLRAARDRLNQTPKNSSRPSGSMPPWRGGTGDASGDASGDTLRGDQDEPPCQTGDTPAEPTTEPTSEQTSPDAPHQRHRTLCPIPPPACRRLPYPEGVPDDALARPAMAANKSSNPPSTLTKPDPGVLTKS